MSGKIKEAVAYQVFHINFFDKNCEYVYPMDILAIDLDDAITKASNIKVGNYFPNFEGIYLKCYVEELPILLRNKISKNGFIKYKRER